MIEGAILGACAYAGGSLNTSADNGIFGLILLFMLAVSYLCILSLFILQCVMSVRYYTVSGQQIYPLIAGLLSLETVLEGPIVLMLFMFGSVFSRFRMRSRVLRTDREDAGLSNHAKPSYSNFA